MTQDVLKLKEADLRRKTNIIFDIRKPTDRDKKINDHELKCQGKAVTKLQNHWKKL